MHRLLLPSYDPAPTSAQPYEGHMVSKTWIAMLVVSASSITVMAAAQETRGTSAAGPVATPAAAGDRTFVIQQFGLNNPALRLTTSQRAEIDKIVTAYVAERAVLNKNYPVRTDERPSEASIQARQAASLKLAAALGGVMDTEQRRTWEAARAARDLSNGSVGGQPRPKVPAR